MDVVFIMIFPILCILLPLVAMIAFYYPVRKKDNTIIIGYPIFYQKYDLLSGNYNFQIEIRQVNTMRSRAWCVLIHVYQNGDLLRTHLVQGGYMFRKNAEKTAKKVEGIIFSNN